MEKKDKKEINKVDKDFIIKIHLLRIHELEKEKKQLLKKIKEFSEFPLMFSIMACIIFALIIKIMFLLVY